MNDVDELLEVLDEAGLPTGRTKPRAQVHRDGDWHRAFHLWVVHADGHVVLQRRAPSKDLAGGCVDVSVAGHVRPGETALDMLREAREEIGLGLRPGEITFLDTVRSERRYPDGAIDREFQDVYAVAVEHTSLEQYVLPCDEVDVVYEAPLARTIDLYRDGTPLAVAGWDCMGRPNHALLVVDDLIGPARAATAASLERVRAWWETRSAESGA
jgi:isopentenyldiphosphate isomerase